MTTMYCMGRELIVGTKTECRDMWNAEPSRRGSLYTEQDVCNMLLMDPAPLAALMDKKLSTPATKVTGIRVGAL